MQSPSAPSPRLPHALIRLCGAAALAAVVSSPAAAAVEVTTCGQTVGNGPAILMADLDCSGFDDVALELGDGKLNLNGFTLTGASPSGVIEQTAAINCTKCRIKGPGTVVGSQYGIQAARLKLRNVVVRDADDIGVFVTRLNMRSSEIVSNGRTLGAPAIWAMAGARLRLQDSRIADNGSGIRAFGRAKISIVDTTIENNRGTEPFISGSGMVGFGIHAPKGRIKLKRSEVRGNAPIPDPPKSRCQIRGCGDIDSNIEPVLVESGCDTSVKLGADGGDGGSTFGICDDDVNFDGDGADNDADLCDYDAACTTEDGDSDGIGDCCDNCPDDSNADQFDGDNDGVGDTCDP